MTTASQLRKYLDIVLNEGECIPLPKRVLRIAGAPLDFYQILKMLANPNLAHKVTYKPMVGEPGINQNDIMMVFSDETSYAEAKDVFQHYKIKYTDSTDTGQGVTSNPTKYVSKNNPPDESDHLHGK